MQLKINGKSEEFPGGSVLDLLKTKKIEPQMVAVEVNDSMVEREQLATTALKEGDRLEFLFYMGGG
ncbi:MAG TPA: sulfur carrier protein ThiS [Nitrospira sp.]|jgi:sulfur carrier protein|nr:sulfur carrier protein ThiS [Nitrospira sp.]HEX5550291.1 sulfur carrier protein ThiS [Nitrospira sp.]